MICRICRSMTGTFHVVPEMMFGTKEEFNYFECKACGCIQIVEYPHDMSKFYEKDYYAYKESGINRGNMLAYWLRKQWVDYGIGKINFIGKLLAQILPIPELYSLFHKYGITRKSPILDVGCGNGRFLRSLYRGGFNNLTGIDSFIAADIQSAKYIHLKKMDIFSLTGTFDFITFNHSFEHLQNQREILVKANSLLSDAGIISIVIPVTGFAWRTYRVNWVQLDAPRHFYIHSRKSLALLAEQANLNIIETFYNSDDFQFWGSEQYARGIPLTDASSYWVNRNSSIFSADQLSEFKARAQKLNECNDGDQAVFILRRAG